MIGRTISRYRVVERIGGGGMGEVYRAHDQRLDRDVALKVLRVPRGTAEDRERIRQEALTLSQLNHPGISTVFDLESSDGVDFLVMELVEGETLDAILARGPLPEPRIRALGRQIAEALAGAHDRGIIHRDLKPANVMVGPHDRVKLLDFGLALLTRGAMPSRDTTDDLARDAIVGTIAYMSPEQLLGRALDARTDLYSLGVVLYEMAAGRRPFVAEPATALINEILNTTPRSPQAFAPSLSNGFARLVLALLEKDPARRPASAGAAGDGLRGDGGERASVAPSAPSPWGDARAPGGVSGGLIASIAVLPLANLTGAADQEYFADGMTEALIATLAQVRTLRVVSRTSVAQYKGTTRALPEIARALGVDGIVEGAVARSADRVRITAQLIDGRLDRHLWAKSYEREVSDVLALQSEVARAIAEEIRVTVSPQDAARLGRAHRVDPEAYEEYLRGRFHWSRRTEESARRAIECFERSIAKDPEYAPAHAGIADAYVTLAMFNYVPPHEAFPRAEAAVARALELDDALADAYVSLGGLRFNAHWDWEGTLAAFGRALALAPNAASAHHWYADTLSALLRPDEAIAESRIARTLDPLSLIVNTSVGLHLFYARRFEEAVEAQKRTLELDPTFAPAVRNLGGAYEELKRYDEAIAAYRRAHELLPRELSAKALLAHAYAVSGRNDEARRLLAELEAASGQRYVAKYALAAIRTGLGEHERALDLLDQAFTARDRGMPWLAASPRLDPLRGYPRFQDLLRRMRLDRPGSLAAAGAPTGGGN
ncbi:MAG TPA: protein kinase [Candidatus Eisenbacteria bacterium]